MWQTRQHKCQVCEARIYEPKAFNFAHILGKGAFPKFKLLLRNIWILCWGCHQDWDFGEKSASKFDELRELEQTLKEEYFRV